MTFEKTLLCIALLAAVASGLNAQTITYSYDASGNRIKRSVEATKTATVVDTVLSDTATVEIPNEDTQPERDENGDDFRILAYPNPTSGILETELPDLRENQKATLEVFSFGGKLMKRIDRLQSRQSVDVSNLPASIYLLRITVDGKPFTMKIIKQ
jgi:hypothetical protein